MSRRRLRSRAVVFDPVELHREILSARYPVIAMPPWVPLIRAQGWPCADGSWTLRLVYRCTSPCGGVISIAQTVSGIRI